MINLDTFFKSYYSFKHLGQFFIHYLRKLPVNREL